MPSVVLSEKGERLIEAVLDALSGRIDVPDGRSTTAKINELREYIAYLEQTLDDVNHLLSLRVGAK